MNRRVAERVYEALLVLYPRRFRREYGEDMALLFAAQLRDEATWRVCARAGTDLALTIPTRYLEATMQRSSSPFLPALFGSIAVAGLASALVAGTSLAIAVGGAIIAVVAGALSLLSYRRNRPLAPSSDSANGWKLAAAGGVVLATMIVVVNLTGEVPDGFWLPMVITGLSAGVMIVLGLLLSVVQMASRRSRRAPVG